MTSFACFAGILLACGGDSTSSATTADSGSDASEGGETGNALDPRCPPSWNETFCGESCSPVGLACSYPGPGGGDALFCTAASGDAGGDAGVDGSAGRWTCGV